MSNWREMLKEAKELFDTGLINDAEYDQMRKEALALRSQSTNPGMTPPTTPAIQGMNTVVNQASLGGYQIPIGVNNLGTIAGQQPISDIGNYKLLEQIGQGSMGTVYRARHKMDAFAQQTGDVVIKLMNPQFAHDDMFRQRFITEAATGRNIQHPNVVRIHEIIIEDHNNILAIVMDLVEGKPLEDLISSNGMPFEQALPIIKQLSDALDHIHSENIIHRDLKPSNIIVTGHGHRQKYRQ
jgi:serine/threonine protein kinase